MKTLYLISNLIIWSVLIMSPVSAQAADYMTRDYLPHSCKLFANDAYQAANSYGRGAMLRDVLESIEGAKVAASMKHRAFQAIQFVWKNKLDNPVLAHHLAMGLCLKPKKEMAPIDQPWITSFRTSQEFL